MQKILKKTWQTLNEILDKDKRTETVEKININGQIESDPIKIATQFNTFSQELERTSLNLFQMLQSHQKTM